MKKTFLTIKYLAFSAITFLMAIPHTLAITGEEKECEGDNLTHDEIMECLFANEKDLIEGSPQGEATLPSGDITGDFLPFFINTALSIAGTLVFVAIIYAGLLMVIANDNEEDIEKGKKILIYAVVGVAFIALSYALIYGVAKLDLD